MGSSLSKFSRAITNQEMKVSNRLAILELLLRFGPTPLSKITDMLPLIGSAVRRIVDELMNEGWILSIVNERGEDHPKQKLLKVNGSEHCVIGIDLGGTKIFGAIINLDGNFLYERYFLHRQTHAEESLGAVCDVINDLLKIAAEKKLNIEGIGIGVPGVTNAATGIVTLAPGLNWQNFPLKNRLEDRYSHPITIENDVNLAAFGESWFGVDRTDAGK